MNRWYTTGAEGGGSGGAGGGAGAGGGGGAGAGSGATGGSASGSGGSSSGGQHDRSDWVPPGRLREEAEQRRKVEAERDALREEATSAWRAAGVSDDDLAVARTLHGRLPEKDRPALGDWLGGFRADASKAPRPLAHLFGAQQGAGAGVGAGAQQGPAGGQQPAGTGTGGTAGVDGAALDLIIRRAQETGDWSEYDKHRGEVLAKLARR